MVVSKGDVPDEHILPGLGYLTANLTAMLAKVAWEKFAPFEITPMQFAILYMCSEGQKDTITALARVIPVNLASISRYVVVLVNRGLIRRVRQRGDRRVVRLELTEEGLALVPRLVEALQEADSLVSMGLDEEEKRAFVGAMRKIWVTLNREGYGDESGTQSMPEGPRQHWPPTLLSSPQPPSSDL